MIKFMEPPINIFVCGSGLGNPDLVTQQLLALSQYERAFVDFHGIFDNSYESISKPCVTKTQKTFSEHELDALLTQFNLMEANTIKSTNFQLTSSNISNSSILTEKNIELVVPIDRTSFYDFSPGNFEVTQVVMSFPPNAYVFDQFDLNELSDIDTTYKIKRAIIIANSYLQSRPDINNRFQEIIEHIVYLLIAIKNLAWLIRSLSLAFIALNRLAGNPSHLKREPPVGGVKIGGGNMAVMLPRYSALLK